MIDVIEDLVRNAPLWALLPPMWVTLCNVLVLIGSYIGPHVPIFGKDNAIIAFCRIIKELIYYSSIRRRYN